jgi:hypothetical protein
MICILNLFVLVLLDASPNNTVTAKTVRHLIKFINLNNSDTSLSKSWMAQRANWMKDNGFSDPYKRADTLQVFSFDKS